MYPPGYSTGMETEVQPAELKSLFCKRLKEARVAAGVSQSELARLMDVPPSYICALENGAKSPQLGTIARLSEHLGVHPDDLLAGRKISA